MIRNACHVHKFKNYHTEGKKEFNFVFSQRELSVNSYTCAIQYLKWIEDIGGKEFASS